MDLADDEGHRIANAYFEPGIRAVDLARTIAAALRATRREALERAAETALNCTVEQYGFQTRMKIHDAIIAEIDTISSLTSGGKPTRGT